MLQQNNNYNQLLQQKKSNYGDLINTLGDKKEKKPKYENPKYSNYPNYGDVKNETEKKFLEAKSYVDNNIRTEDLEKQKEEAETSSLYMKSLKQLKSHLRRDDVSFKQKQDLDDKYFDFRTLNVYDEVCSVFKEEDQAFHWKKFRVQSSKNPIRINFPLPLSKGMIPTNEMELTCLVYHYFSKKYNYGRKDNVSVEVYTSNRVENIEATKISPKNMKELGDLFGPSVEPLEITDCKTFLYGTKDEEQPTKMNSLGVHTNYYRNEVNPGVLIWLEKLEMSSEIDDYIKFTMNGHEFVAVIYWGFPVFLPNNVKEDSIVLSQENRLYITRNVVDSIVANAGNMVNNDIFHFFNKNKELVSKQGEAIFSSGMNVEGNDEKKNYFLDSLFNFNEVNFNKNLEHYFDVPVQEMNFNYVYYENVLYANIYFEIAFPNELIYKSLFLFNSREQRILDNLGIVPNNITNFTELKNLPKFVSYYQIPDNVTLKYGSGTVHDAVRFVQWHSTELNLAEKLMNNASSFAKELFMYTHDQELSASKLKKITRYVVGMMENVRKLNQIDGNFFINLSKFNMPQAAIGFIHQFLKNKEEIEESFLDLLAIYRGEQLKYHNSAYGVLSYFKPIFSNMFAGIPQSQDLLPHLRSLDELGKIIKEYKEKADTITNIDTLNYLIKTRLENTKGKLAYLENNSKDITQEISELESKMDNAQYREDWQNLKRKLTEKQEEYHGIIQKKRDFEKQTDELQMYWNNVTEMLQRKHMGKIAEGNDKTIYHNMFASLLRLSNNEQTYVEMDYLTPYLINPSNRNVENYDKSIGDVLNFYADVLNDVKNETGLIDGLSKNINYVVNQISIRFMDEKINNNGYMAFVLGFLLIYVDGFIKTWVIDRSSDEMSGCENITLEDFWQTYQKSLGKNPPHELNHEQRKNTLKEIKKYRQK
jgi:hypothetical protein